MKPNLFLNALEHEKIQQSITRAEQHTSADIVVFITHKKSEDALADAQEIFVKRGLDETEAASSLLIFVSPTSRTFAVVGGKALHVAMGQAWWDELAAILRRHFRAKYYSEGLRAAIDFVSKGLRGPFPLEEDTDRTGQDDIVEE